MTWRRAFREAVTDLFEVAVLIFVTSFAVSAMLYNWQHPDLTQMRVLLSISEWNWIPVAAVVSVPWCFIITWKRINKWGL